MSPLSEVTLSRFLTWAGLHPLATSYFIVQEDDGSGYTILDLIVDTGPPIRVTIDSASPPLDQDT